VFDISFFASVPFAEEPTPGYNHHIPEEIMTPDTVDTRIGKLEFFDGMPNADTVERAYDNLDFMRGVDVFLNFVPATSLEGMRRGMESLGASKPNQVVVMDTLLHSGPLFLTGNTDTVYASIILDLATDGPAVGTHRRFNGAKPLQSETFWTLNSRKPQAKVVISSQATIRKRTRRNSRSLSSATRQLSPTTPACRTGIEARGSA
jgi:hypothetical protein